LKCVEWVAKDDPWEIQKQRGLEKPTWMRRSTLDHPLGRYFVPRENDYGIIRKAMVIFELDL